MIIICLLAIHSSSGNILPDVTPGICNFAGVRLIGTFSDGEGNTSKTTITKKEEKLHHNIRQDVTFWRLTGRQIGPSNKKKLRTPLPSSFRAFSFQLRATPLFRKWWTSSQQNSPEIFLTPSAFKTVGYMKMNLSTMKVLSLLSTAAAIFTSSLKKRQFEYFLYDFSGFLVPIVPASTFERGTDMSQKSYCGSVTNLTLWPTY